MVGKWVGLAGTGEEGSKHLLEILEEVTKIHTKKLNYCAWQWIINILQNAISKIIQAKKIMLKTSAWEAKNTMVSRWNGWS